MRSRLPVLLLLGIQGSLLGWNDWTTSPNRTEVGHMAATVYFWHTLRFDVFHVNPPLTRFVSGLPVILCRPQHNWDDYSSRPQDRPELALGTAFLDTNTATKIRWCFAAARWSLIPLMLVGGYFGYRMSRELYGGASGIVFLALWCFSPLLLGWGATICPDAAGAALGIIAIYYFRRWLEGPSWSRAAVAGVCLGLLPLSKLTWLVALAVWPAIWCVWIGPICLARNTKGSLCLPPLRQLVTLLLIGLYTLNLGYLFDGTFRPLGKYEFNSKLFCSHQPVESQRARIANNRFARTWLGAIRVPLPAELVQGLDTQQCDFERGIDSYLRGEWSEHGWWYYYLYVALVKMPVGTWCLLFLAVFATAFGGNYNAAWRQEMLILTPLVTLSIFVSSQTGFSVHPRYIILVVPFLFLWISKLGKAFEMRHRVVAGVTVISLTWLIASSLSIYPHSLSYFNELVGGPKNGPKHLLGSNVDWGQDLFYLEDWCRKHFNASPIRVAYDGIYPLEKTTIPTTGATLIRNDDPALQNVNGIGWEPQPGWYALSVNHIYGPSKSFRSFLKYEPVAMAGYSIYIYDITTGDR